MRFTPGFENQILDALSSPNQEIRYETVCAAGNWGIDAAWRHIETILDADQVDKTLLIAAIEAAVAIRPQEAVWRLAELADSEDEDIANAVFEASAMAETLSELEGEDG